MDIYLLRHGETDWNKMGRLQGHADTDLNERGRAQVAEAAEKLHRLGVRMDVIVASPLKRAQESARIAAACLDFPADNIVAETLLMERSFGEAEGMTLAEADAKYADRQYPGMESREELIRRAGHAFQKITDAFQGAERILLAAHGAVLFALLEAVSEEPIPYQGRAACIAQGSIYRIRREDGKNRFAVYDEDLGMFVEADEEKLGRLAKIYL